ncbi:MAG: class I SAM-dependent methyltransferase [Xanthobacteraceae bacterium]|nr:class I SAM-dependent methyltransferase [Xanthobacteraceae bacterium]
MRHAQRYADAIFKRVYAVGADKRNILDFGAGDGVFAERFLVNDLPVDCVEPDPALRAMLAKTAKDVYTNIADVPIDHYDLVYSINVLEHIQNVENALDGIRRSMRSGAVFFVLVPAFPVLWTSLDDEVGHVQRFTRATLERCLASAGFQTIDIRYFDSIGFAAALSVRILEKVGLFQYSNNSVSIYDRYLVRPSLTIDRLTSRWFGKNLIATVRKPAKVVGADHDVSI